MSDFVILDFLISRFIQPIDKPIQLSKKVPYYFDNLRNETEKRVFLEILENSYVKYSQEFDNSTQFEFLLSDELKNYFSYLTKKYPNLSDKLNSYNLTHKDDFFKALVDNWVIIRFDTNIHSEYFERQKKFAEKAKTDNEVFFPYQDKKDFVIEYTSLHLMLLEFLSCEEINFDFPPPIKPKYLHNEITFGFHGHIIDNAWGSKSANYSLETFDSILPTYKNWANLIEPVLVDLSNDKLMYISSLLESAKTNFNSKFEFLVLNSIIELLLTRNPDFNRFNIEDSISKQFILKTATVMYNYDSTIDLADLKKELQFIYNLRSKIAHGDFNELSKIYRKHIKDDGTLDSFIDEYSDKLYYYVQIILKSYLLNPTFINFLKEN